MDVAIYPGLEGQKVSQVDSLGELTFSVSLELLVKSFFCGREFHGGIRSHERFLEEGCQLHSANNRLLAHDRANPVKSTEYGRFRAIYLAGKGNGRDER